MSRCVYLDKPPFARRDHTGQAVPCETPEDRQECTWADRSPEGLEAMNNLPRWIQRWALSGQGWITGDCEGCPKFTPHPQPK